MINKILRVFIYQAILITGSFSQSVFQLHTTSELSNNSINNSPFWAKMNKWGTNTSYKNNAFNLVNISFQKNISQSILPFGLVANFLRTLISASVPSRSKIIVFFISRSYNKNYIQVKLYFLL